MFNKYRRHWDKLDSERNAYKGVTKRMMIDSKNYRLEISDKEPSKVVLMRKDGFLISSLFIASSCNTLEELDRCIGIEKPIIKRESDTTEIIIHGKSSLWEKKEYFFVCRDDEIEYYYKVKGKGKISDCMFFQGHKGESGYSGSMPGFDVVFNPQPNGLDYRYFKFSENTQITVTSNWNPDTKEWYWYFVPAPFCYVTGDRDKKKWTSLGLVVRPGEYNFVKYEYRGGKRWGLNLTYEGHTQVRGEWESPHILIQFCDNEYTALKNYVSWLKDEKMVDIPERKIVPWWREPIFCAWGEQLYYVYLSKNTSRDVVYSTQANYERHLKKLESVGINPGIIVIEARWNVPGESFPDIGKWPEMRNFIDEQHNKGRHVLLWYGTWWEHRKDYFDSSIKSITENGEKLICDPSNPEFEKKMREFVRKTLSSDKGCLNADGYKVDLTADTPSGREIRTYGKIWGIELLKKYHWIIYDEAKKIKPDSLIETHCANPYFADVTDMLRLNDVPPNINDVVDMMIHRDKIAKIACPDCLIDCENAPMPNHNAWIEYMKFQPEIGVPLLSYVTHIAGDGSQITRKDYEIIVKIWNDYRKRNKLIQG